MTGNAEDPGDCTDGIFGLGVSPEDAALVLVPVPFDATASYRRAAADGPACIMQASIQLDLFSPKLGKPYEAGIAMLAQDPHLIELNQVARRAVDTLRNAPDAQHSEKVLAQVNDIGEQVEAWLRKTVVHWQQQGKIVGVVGGDHSTPLGSIALHAQKYPNVGILHIDAHADLRQAYEGFESSHASIMHNVLHKTSIKKIVQVGIRDFCASEYEITQNDPRVRTFFEDDIRSAQMRGRSLSDVFNDIISELPHEVYVSFDIDGLIQLCPGTGTPVPGGLLFHEMKFLLHALAESGRQIVGFDLCEVAPPATTASTMAMSGHAFSISFAPLSLSHHPNPSEFHQVYTQRIGHPSLCKVCVWSVGSAECLSSTTNIAINHDPFAAFTGKRAIRVGCPLTFLKKLSLLRLKTPLSGHLHLNQFTSTGTYHAEIPPYLPSIGGNRNLLSAKTGHLDSLLDVSATLSGGDIAAKSLFVAPTGSDANPGTEELPFENATESYNWPAVTPSSFEENR
ncbi:MAG: agmatinase family protein [Myxococcota bacterium]